MKMLPKKLSKSLFVSVLAMILVGSAAAAFMWISNQIKTDVVVMAHPVELTGSFTATAFTNEEITEEFDYVVNTGMGTEGYICLEFTTMGLPGFNPSMIEISEVFVVEFAGIVQPGALVSGYPKQTSPDIVTFVYEQDTLGPFDFYGEGPGSGEIYVTLTYKSSFAVTATIQITSTSS